MTRRVLLFSLLAVASTTTVLAQSCLPGASWCSGTYAYDGAGNIRAIGSDVYIYDTAGRLVSGTADVQRTGVLSQQFYSYDAFGNRTVAGRVGGSVDCLGGCELSPPIDTSTNHIISAQYDAAGNLTSIQDSIGSTTYTASYTFDTAGRLARAVAGSDVRDFIYTAEDERIATANGASWTWTVRGMDGKVLREFTSMMQNGLPTANRVWTKDYVWRDGLLLASITPTSAGTVSPTLTEHFHLDHLGSPRLVTGDNGVQLGLHAYYPFGTELNLALNEQPYELMKFTGHERDLLANDPHTLDDMHARYYSPTVGRFLSVDPAMDVQKTIRSPQMWNRYAYVSDNPMRYTDPNGREVYEQVQNVAGDNYHTSIRIEPVDQARWAKDPRFSRVDPATHRHYATIGAGPEHDVGALFGNAGKLVGAVNRTRDANLSIKVETIKLDLGKRDENKVISDLFKAQTSYKNDANYVLFPDNKAGYNSNSFASGLLLAVGLQPVQPQHNTPGFAKPLPNSEFQADRTNKSQ
ncbi:MAG TPA: RHS repeat-associated core domain-containing protein [Thermoanaerobaculia bacterium]|jgi:RHS repeat-associated protein|nr:RHS repeat-associated core domain-containing protein [Thermoanaerobaculia bacterium]